MAGTHSRLIGLDVLRFAATSIVIISHANGFGDAGKIFYQIPGIFGRILQLLPRGGWTAVVIFFVLSGFLVSGLLFNEARATGSVSVGRFLIRRGFKIYPAFWVMLGCTIAWTLWRGAPIPVGAIFCELFYFQNYGVAVCFHTWSLAVEEHFYFLIAGWFYLLKWRARSGGKLNFDGIPNLFLTVAVLCLVLRVVTWAVIVSYTTQNSHWFLQADHAVIDSLFFGVMLSYFWHIHWDERMKQRIISLRWLLAVGGVVLLSPGFVEVMDIQWFQTVGFILVYLGAGCLLLGSLSLDSRRRPFFIRWPARLGRYSYSVYLWHVLTGACLFPLVQLKMSGLTGAALNALIYFTLCWLVGIVLACLIELPMLRLRDRWYPSLAKK